MRSLSSGEGSGQFVICNATLHAWWLCILTRKGLGVRTSGVPCNTYSDTQRLGSVNICHERLILSTMSTEMIRDAWGLVTG